MMIGQVNCISSAQFVSKKMLAMILFETMLKKQKGVDKSVRMCANFNRQDKSVFFDLNILTPVKAETYAAAFMGVSLYQEE